MKALYDETERSAAHSEAEQAGGGHRDHDGLEEPIRWRAGVSALSGKPGAAASGVPGPPVALVRPSP